jgi:hypothetical protein
MAALIAAVRRYDYGREFNVGLKVVLDARLVEPHLTPLHPACVFMGY